MTIDTMIDSAPPRPEIQIDDKQTGQVQLHDLVFSQSWEDPRSDILAFGEIKGKTLFSISSGGDNTLDFLLGGPKRIYAVDINPAQNFVLELKRAAARHLPYAQFAALMGIQAATDRLALYKSIQNNLPPRTREYWDSRPEAIQKGILYAGKFEGFLRYARLLLRLLQGKRRIQGLFSESDSTRQQQFFDEHWDNWRMRLLFKLVFHPSIYPRGALKANYFKFKDEPTSFAESFYRRFRHVLRDIPINGNYFLAMYLLGRYRNPTEMPLYLQEMHYATLREHLDRLQVFTDGATTFLEGIPDNSIDCFSLSNICELMSEPETQRLFNEVARTAAPGAKICFRNLIIPRNAPPGVIKENESLSAELLLADRSFIYSKVMAYHVVK